MYIEEKVSLFYRWPRAIGAWDCAGSGPARLLLATSRAHARLLLAISRAIGEIAKSNLADRAILLKSISRALARCPPGCSRATVNTPPASTRVSPPIKKKMLNNYAELVVHERQND